MHELVYLPFVATVALVLLIRTGSGSVSPRAGAWAIGVSTMAVAIASSTALALLASPLLARLPLVAHLGRWQPSVVALRSPVPAWLSLSALACSVAVAWRVATQLHVSVGELRRATAAHRGLPSGSPEVVVATDDTPGAFALARPMRRVGRIFITTGMLDLLDDEERAAVLAHEHAHLVHRHDLFLAACDLAASINPMLRFTRPHLRFHLERWADEEAAAQTSRATTASALAKAALGTLQPTLSLSALSLHAHGVPERVAALLDDQRRDRPRLAWLLFGLAAVTALAVTYATHDTERFFETVRRY